jgi:hypothetical protein
MMIDNSGFNKGNPRPFLKVLIEEEKHTKKETGKNEN